MKITHLSVHQVYKDRLFDNINSYHDMNLAIQKYGGSTDTERDRQNYTYKTGYIFEIYTQFFFIRYNNIPRLGVSGIQDTSDTPLNAGFDFRYKNLSGLNGHIQSKWRSNPMHQFAAMDMGTNGDAAYGFGVKKDDNILFINFDDTDNLFHYEYDTIGRNGRRIIGRKTQEEEYILLDGDNGINFWNSFRECIKKSAENVFVDMPPLRDVQRWVLEGKDDYLGTQAVINGLVTKGRVEAATASGKSLCILNDVISFFEAGRKLAVVIIPWITLIEQTFEDFYKYKIFGSEKNGVKQDSNISCLIIRSGNKTRYNSLIADVYQTLVPEHAVGFILSKIAMGRKVVLFITNESYNEKYLTLLDSLFQKGVTKNDIIEIIDEYHNIIPSSGLRLDHLLKAEYLMTLNERNSGTIFYSASNKIGNIVSSLNEEQFGPLLAKVTRNDLKIRGYVSPKLIFKILNITPVSNSYEKKRIAERTKLDIDKAQNEAVGIIRAFNDLRNYYAEPNLITFGDHVPGCSYIASNNVHMDEYLPNVSKHFMASKTLNSDRKTIIDKIRASGNNILNQHSVAKEGVNIPNLHSGLIDRSMDYKTLQQAIGRSDRAMYVDTVNLQKGNISLDNPFGWTKYYNIIYVIVDDNDFTFKNRVKDIIRYLLENGIPETEWDMSIINDEERNGINNILVDSAPSLLQEVSFDNAKFRRMINSLTIEVIDELDILSPNMTMECISNALIDEYSKLEKTALANSIKEYYNLIIEKYKSNNYHIKSTRGEGRKDFRENVSKDFANGKYSKYAINYIIWNFFKDKKDDRHKGIKNLAVPDGLSQDVYNFIDTDHNDILVFMSGM